MSAARAETAADAPRRRARFWAISCTRKSKLYIFVEPGYIPSPMAGDGGHGVMRRLLATAALVSAALTIPAAGAVANPIAPPAAHASKATILHKTVVRTGRYNVVVSLRARHRHSEMVTVYIAGQPTRRVRAYPHLASRLTYDVSLTSATALFVDAVSDGPAVDVTVTATRHVAKQSKAVAPVTTSASATPPTTTPAAFPASRPPPHQRGGGTSRS